MASEHAYVTLAEIDPSLAGLILGRSEDPADDFVTVDPVDYLDGSEDEWSEINDETAENAKPDPNSRVQACGMSSAVETNDKKTENAMSNAVRCAHVDGMSVPVDAQQPSHKTQESEKKIAPLPVTDNKTQPLHKMISLVLEHHKSRDDGLWKKPANWNKLAQDADASLTSVMAQVDTASRHPGLLGFRGREEKRRRQGWYMVGEKRRQKEAEARKQEAEARRQEAERQVGASPAPTRPEFYPNQRFITGCPAIRMDDSWDSS
ncbi:uncharacterized protein AB675_6782 [Cyphellophora attinorum]|uniref:Uncharacterized protein n=1 Tax=Cyphellophora attinorum TaxID=1664694 RepID=A0A0N0NQ44_9EURO|nr:uncharacterized protein AB675_6782 [Phialophora attinorum]KPI43478.1 hypothetical protein AB675_6782 [Phialophora attinorum]